MQIFASQSVSQRKVEPLVALNLCATFWRGGLAAFEAGARGASGEICLE